MLKPCPCQSGLAFIKCCKPFITGKALPQTAEQLMRSRYSAYTRANTDYIQTTQTPESVPNFNVEDAKHWAQSAKWLGLKVIRTENGQIDDNTGTVEFIARYKLNGKMYELHEASRFTRINGRWVYQGQQPQVWS